MKYAFAKTAERRVDVIDRWWKKHRPKVADVFREELDDAVLQILDAALVPPIHRVVRGVEYRRVLTACRRAGAAQAQVAPPPSCPSGRAADVHDQSSRAVLVLDVVPPN